MMATDENVGGYDAGDSKAAVKNFVAMQHDSGFVTVMAEAGTA